MRNLTIATCIALCLACVPQTADAEDSGWSFKRKKTTVDVRRSAAADFEYTSVNLATTDTSRPELRFGCSRKYGLTATLVFQPLDHGELNGGARFKYKKRFVRFEIEGRDAERSQFTHIKEMRLLQTRHGKTARMLYNAVVQGRSFTIREPLKSNVTITPPPIDDAFKLFVRECYITNGEND